jgi:hypothetical protein
MSESRAGTTRPADRALVYARPRTWEECVGDLEARVADAHPLDFAYHMVGRDDDWAEHEARHSLYSRRWQTRGDKHGLTDAIADVFAAARGAGVTIIEAATLEAFAGAVKAYPVVTLVTHWKGHTVFEDDVLDWQGFASKLACPTSGILRWLAGRLEPGDLRRLDKPVERPRFLGALNKALESGRFDKDVIRVELLDGFHNRNALDAALAGVLRPGNRAEFRDGMHTIEEVERCLPVPLAGTLDLTVCNSVLLGEGVKARPGRRESLVLVNEKPTPLTLRLLMYKHAILDVEATGRDYREAVSRLRSLLAFGRTLPMTDLKEVLTKAVDPTDVTLGQADDERLREALKTVGQSNERYFALVMGLLVVFFLASWVLVFMMRGEPTTLGGIFAALGGSVIGGIWMMARMWRQKVATDIILATLNDLKPAQRTLVWQRILEML